jgi:O-antigen/teichoic acid export membrane protein
MNLDKILIGKFLGMSSLGVYTLAKDLAARSMLVVNPIVNKLCLPKYASIQRDKKLLANEVGNTFIVLGFFSSLIFFSLSITSELVVFLMYGSGNEQTANILSVLAFYMLFRSFSNVISTLLNSVGNTKLDFKWQCIAGLVGMPCIYLLVQYDMNTMVIGMVFLQFSFVVMSYFVSLKPILPLSFVVYIRRAFIFPIIGLIALYPLSFYQEQVSLIDVLLNYIQWLFCYLMMSLLLFKSPLKKYI